jgi:hypothetical protein
VEPTSTFTSGACGAAKTSLEHAELTAWADEYTDNKHGAETRWPNTFTIRYARRHDAPNVGAHYRWPGGVPVRQG